MTNARCLTEGVDVPAIDCVLFADPKQSKVDIVQAAGRALRPYEGKTHGYIMLPIIVPGGMNFEEFAETTEFRHVARVITAMSTQDGRIAEEFRLKQFGRVPTGKIIEIEGSVAVGAHIDIREFSEAIETKLWEHVGRANWRSFEDSRAFARSLGLKSATEWFHYCKSGSKPADIPASPHVNYAQAGWAGYGDWLGTGNVPDRLRQYRSFEEARVFVRGLGLKTGTQWRDYCDSGKKPDDIPSNAHRTYADEGWAGMGDWLGTGNISNRLRQYRPFEEARAFVRGLGLKSQSEWADYCSSSKKPEDIPTNPHRNYADEGWAGMGDWLGTGYISPRLRQYRPFEEARAFVHGLELKSQDEWLHYTKSGKKPDDVPASPHLTYADEGWAGMGDWLGTGTIAPRLRQYRPFEEARVFARTLEFKSNLEWKDYCKSGQKPDDIPAKPNATYADEGWAGWGDWLGTGTVATYLRKYKPFKEARAFVRALGLKSQSEWGDYAKSGKKPDDIPASPVDVYLDHGWAGTGDWLGTGRVADRFRQYRPFEKARAFVRGLGLKSRSEWKAYCRSGKKPDDIPSKPDNTYAGAGWLGMRDWLGTEQS